VLCEIVFDFLIVIVQAIKWGRDHEAAARRSYVNNHSKTHPHVEVADCGLFLHESLPYLASSPDGLVRCAQCKSAGLIEIKCPYSQRNSTVEEASQEGAFFCTIVDGKVTLKKQHQYYFQVQGQMGVTGLRWCDFVVWTLKGMHVERICFNESLWASMLVRLERFFLKGVVPELFSRRVQRNRVLYSAE
jgi:hypothetical protein